MHQLSRLGLAFAFAVIPVGFAFAQANAYRGLWIGQVTLSRATEVTVPLDENNVPVAPNPAVPTATADEAHLRVILHVNGAGQVSLLKDVAVLDRSGGTNNLAVGGAAESEGQVGPGDRRTALR